MLGGAVFDGALLVDADFSHAHLFSGAALRSVDFRDAMLRNARLDDADLQGAALGKTLFRLIPGRRLRARTPLHDSVKLRQGQV